tara:strand:- start:6608 stop:6979 length:372 start_codon:yes stop_codon:yes gene_type:complete
MSIDKDYLKELWNSVWEKGLTELEVQQRYFAKLDKELKGEDRFHLLAIKRKIDEMEADAPFKVLLSKIKQSNSEGVNIGRSENLRSEGDGTEWILETDKNGRVFKRVIGSDEKIYIDKNVSEK